MNRYRLILFSLLSFALVGLSSHQVQAQKDQRNLTVAAAPAASSDKRVALVIGNSSYKSSPLKNPVNDAHDMAVKLRELGFEVIERSNLSSRQIGGTMRELRAKLTPGSVALVFYAGHGLQIKGENYLPAVDAEIETEDDVPNQSLALNQVLRVLDDAKTRLNLVFLDACRNNPYARSFRSGEAGLAKVAAPSGTLMSFATRPGSVAADGDGRNGLYTSHLLNVLDSPNQPVELMLKRVTTAVKTASNGRQEPWMEGSIEGDFYFKTVAYDATPEAQAAQKERQQAIDQAVQDAVKVAQEKAAKERAELQATMQRMIEQALVKQAAMLEAERLLRAQAEAEIPQGQAKSPLLPTAQPPVATSPALKPNTSDLTTALSALAKPLKPPQPGDEWEFSVKEAIFEKTSKLIWRVKAATDTGTLEELLLDGRSVVEWVFGSEMDAISAPTDAGFILSPSWNGSAQQEINVHGVGSCIRRLCSLREVQIKAKEMVTVPAGKFEAVRVDATVYAVGMTSIKPIRIARVTFWYAASNQRLIKQETVRTNNFGNIRARETVELQVIRERSNS